MLRRILSTVLALSICLLSVSPFCTALGRTVIDTPAEEQLVNVKTEKQGFITAITFAYTLVSTVFEIAEIAGTTTNSVKAGMNSHQNGGDFWDVAAAAGSTLIGLDDTAPGVNPEDISAMNSKLDTIKSDVSSMHKELSTGISVINSKLDDLSASLEEVNANIEDVNNTIIVEANKAYINAFTEKYVLAMKTMIGQYNLLIQALDSPIDGIKPYYDQLYLDTANTINLIEGYIDGSYREFTDKKPIQEIYLDSILADTATSSDRKAVYEKCCAFTAELYSSYVLAQYCMLLCTVYQLTYLEKHDESNYSVNGIQYIPVKELSVSFGKMRDSYLSVLSSVLAFYIRYADYDSINVSYSTAAVGDMMSAPFSAVLSSRLRMGDEFSLPMPADRSTMLTLGESDWFDVSVSDTSVAEVVDGERIRVIAESGSFDVSIAYEGKHIITYSFSVGRAPFSGGYGTESAPYLIGTPNDILALSTAPADAHYRMIADIDMGGVTIQESMMPVLNGNFDGNGYKISSLIIENDYSTSCKRVGLFGQNNGLISNLNVEQITVKSQRIAGDRSIGILAGRNGNAGRIINCRVSSSTVKISGGDCRTAGGGSTWVCIGGAVGESQGEVYGCTVQGINLDIVLDYSSLASGSGEVINYCAVLIGYVGYQGEKKTQYNLVSSCSLSTREIYHHLFLSNDGANSLTIGNMKADAEAVTFCGENDISCKVSGNTKTINDSAPVPDDPALYGQYGLCLDENGEVTLDRNAYESVEVVGAQDTFYLGDSFTLGGGKLVLTYKNGSKQTVPITSLEGFDTSVSGEGRVRATYVPPYGDPISAEYTINVNCLHVWSDMGVVTEPTHLTEGEQNYSCKHCGEERTVSVEKKAEHTFTDFIPAGNNGHKPICECGEDILLEHEYDEGAVILFPTYFASGVSVFTCTDCGFEKRESTPPIQNNIPAGAPVISGSSSYATSGKTVKVSFDLNSNPGISFLLVTLEFDTAALTLVGVENGEVLGNLESGLNLVWDAASDSTMNGKLVTLTFAVNDGTEGTYKVTPVFREAYDSANRPVAVYTLPANVRVAELTHGDANADGRVSGVDLVILRNYLANLDFDSDVSTVGVNLGADCNGDGEINGKDLLLLRKYMANYDYNTGESTVVLGPAGGASND